MLNLILRFVTFQFVDEHNSFVLLDTIPIGCNKLTRMERKKRKAKFVHIGNIIGDVLKNYRRESDAELIMVWQIWDSIVGDVISPNAKPAAFKGRVLLVHVSSSTWIHQLQFLKKEMIAKLNHALGKTLIDDLKFKIGPLGGDD